jgi:hypothetical protein
MNHLRSIALTLVALTLLAAIPQMAAGVATISIEPPSSEVLKLETFWIDVVISEDVLGVTGYDLLIDFDESLLEVLQVVEGDLPGGYSGETFFTYIEEGQPSDALLINGAVLGGSVDGPGSLARIEFVGHVPGVSPVSFVSVELRDLENAVIPATPVDGEVEVLSVGTIYFDPALSEVLEFQTFWVDVAIDGEMLGVTGYDLVIDFDESLLEVLDVEEGDLPSGYPGETFLFWTVDTSPPRELIINGAILGGSIDGPGSLVRIEFRALAPGTTPLTFTDIELRDLENVEIPWIEENGIVIIEPVGRIYFDPAFQEVFEDSTVCVDVAVDELVLGITGYHLEIDFDQTLLDVISVEEAELPTGYPGETFLFWSMVGDPPDTLLIDGGFLGGSVDGPGSLVTICFHAVAPGLTPLEFFNVEIRDLDNVVIPVGDVPGAIEIIAEPTAVNRESWGAIKARFR